jgi:hypothetical protein
MDRKLSVLASVLGIVVCTCQLLDRIQSDWTTQKVEISPAILAIIFDLTLVSVLLFRRRIAFWIAVMRFYH